MGNQYVSKKEWESYCDRERERLFAERLERDKESHRKWEIENNKLLNPPPPPAKPKAPPEPPDISDVKFADYQFARGGLVELETRESEDGEIVTGTRVRRRSQTTKSKGGNLVDSYSD